MRCVDENQPRTALPVKWLLLNSPPLAAFNCPLTAKKAVLLDVREKDEWDDGHLKDAMPAPISALKTADGAKRCLEKLPKGKIVYTHCAVGGRALAAAKVLRQHGIDVRPLKAGYDDLVEAGFEKAGDEGEDDRQ
jgi:phage shock protein E